MKTAQPEPKRRSALLSRDVMATSSAWLMMSSIEVKGLSPLRR